MANKLYRGDLPADLTFGSVVAVDTETMGLHPHRDRLCLVQLSAGDGNAHLVQIPKGPVKAPRLAALLADPKVLKLFHFGRFDIAMLEHALAVRCEPVYCTKIAARLVRNFTDRWGLKERCKGLPGVDPVKQQQTLDWVSDALSEEQLAYAASDVLHLHALKAKLDVLLEREGRTELAKAAFQFLPTRARLDLAGWPEVDIFEH